MNNMVLKYGGILLIMILIASCTKLNTNVQDQAKYLKIAEVASSGSSFNVGFYAKDSLFVGYNKVYFKITDKSTNVAVTQSTLALHPLMNMGTYSHACPFENPGSTLNGDGYFEGAVLFSMIGTNSWSLSADISANGKSETALFAIDKVLITSPVKKIVVIDSLSTGPGTWTITKYPMSIIGSDKWKVGNNPFEITVHTMASMMSFPFCSDLTIEIDPQMPSMGHGSPNNVNPVHTSNGHYAGTVNFTMTGAWRINMVIKKTDRLISNKAYFDITF
jgi:hypothetical protein